MKRFIYAILLIMTMAPYVFSASNRETEKAMFDSNNYLRAVNNNIVKNFRYDNNFSGYMRNRVLLFETERQRQVGLIFQSKYFSDIANYVIEQNEKEIENYKALVNKYCEFNAYKFAKKNPSACSENTINNLF